MKIRWASRAQGQLEHVQNLTHVQWPGSVEKVTRSIHEIVERLAEFPLSGRDGMVTGTREAVLTRYPFTVVYIVEGDALIVLGVFHQAQTTVL
jgi:toxin ParE1/3/4